MTPPDEQPIFNLSRLLRLVLVAALIGAVVVGSLTVNIGLLTLEPGPASSAVELIDIEGARTYSSQGRFLLTTVTLYEASLARAVKGWTSKDVAVVPRSAFYPPGSTTEDINRETASQMDESQFQAAVAALKVLGFQLPRRGALIVQTQKDTPAGDALFAGDAIIAVNGIRVADVAEAQRLIGDQPLGQTVELRVLREGNVENLRLRTIEGEEGRAVIGVEVIQNYELPFRVQIDAGAIGGPSAGLTFALVIADLLGPEDLTGGFIVADTGTIDGEGRIGPVGGIAQKVAGAEDQGADVFLVPKSQLADARAAADTSMMIIGVSTLQEAVDALRDLT
jgi:PDZ domain-containing protein